MQNCTTSYPMSDKGSNLINLEKMYPKEVTAKAPFDYSIKVTNLSERDLTNVIVTDGISSNIRITNSMPKITEKKGDNIYWNLGTLGAKASEVITVSAVAGSEGAISSCAKVSYDSPICAKINVVEPKLTIAKFAPSEVLMCDRIPVKYVVTNTGSGSACDIKIKDTFQKGLMTAEGKNEVMFSLASLEPGKSQEFSVMLDASQTGRFASKADVTSRTAGEVFSNMTETLVSQPQLAVSSSGPKSQYLGREVTYNIEVTNKGTGMAKNTTIVASVPENVSFKSATLGGVYTHSSPGKVTWNLGVLNPNTSKKLSVSLVGDNVGELTTNIMAKAYCSPTAAASETTILQGIPGILLEVVDTMDPVEIGESGTYVITVTNQGTAADTNIKITCMMEEGMEYLDSTGPTTATLSGDQLMFGALASLAPKEQAQWRVNFKATSTGGKLFKTTMETSQLGRTVTETESTNLYK